MSVLASKDPLRPSGAFGNWLAGLMLGAAPTCFALLRAVAPILKLGTTFVVTRYDDVIEAFGSDASFDTPYRENIEILTGGEPFFLGLRDGPDYREALGAMRSVFKAEDLRAIGDKAEVLADAIVQEANGELEIVGDLVRNVTLISTRTISASRKMSMVTSMFGRRGFLSFNLQVHQKTRPCGPKSMP